METVLTMLMRTAKQRGARGVFVFESWPDTYAACLLKDSDALGPLMFETAGEVKPVADAALGDLAKRLLPKPKPEPMAPCPHCGHWSPA